MALLVLLRQFWLASHFWWVLWLCSCGAAAPAVLVVETAGAHFIVGLLVLVEVLNKTKCLPTEQIIKVNKQQLSTRISAGSGLEDVVVVVPAV